MRGMSLPDQSPAYRPDIDGLRAIAVVAVILFHLFDLGNFNGYLGVDIFFVISGYLITRMVHAEMQEQKFSFIEFYYRRAKRIFPALLTVLTVTAGFSAWLLMPGELLSFGKSLMAASAFVSNILFWSEVDYFNAQAMTKPLLHTWSLAVEEQFYIFFPIGLWIMHKLFRNYIKLCLGFCLVVSFYLYLLAPYKHPPEMAFYFSPMRAWELLFGSLLAVTSLQPYFQPLNSKWMLRLGMGLILISLFMDKLSGAWASVPNLLAVLGASSLIAAGSFGQAGATPTRLYRCLVSKPVVVTGKLSYSLYLWHWPIFVLLTYTMLEQAEWLISSVSLALTIGLSYLTWKYIETPFRQNTFGWSRGMMFASCTIGFAVLIMAGALIYQQRGFMPWHDKNIISHFEVTLGQNVPKEEVKFSEQPIWFLGSGTNYNEATMVIWGDSHGKALTPAVFEMMKERNQTGLFIHNECYFVTADLVQTDAYRQCYDITQKNLDFILATSSIKTVILSQRWSARVRNWKKIYGIEQDKIFAIREASLRELATTFKQHGKQLVIVSPTPEIESRRENIPSVLARARHYGQEIDLHLDYATYLKQEADMLRILKALEAEGLAHIIWIADILCPDHQCQMEDESGFYYYDDDHISSYFARKLVPALKQVVTN